MKRIKQTVNDILQKLFPYDGDLSGYDYHVTRSISIQTLTPGEVIRSLKTPR